MDTNSGEIPGLTLMSKNSNGKAVGVGTEVASEPNVNKVTEKVNEIVETQKIQERTAQDGGDQTRNDPISANLVEHQSEVEKTSNEAESNDPVVKQEEQDAIDRALTNNPIEYSSDEESGKDTDMSKGKSVETTSSPEQNSGSASEGGNPPIEDSVNSGSRDSTPDSESDSDSDPGSDSNSSSDSDSDEDDANSNAPGNMMEESDDESSGPLKSKNEIDAPIPEIPSEFVLKDSAPIEYIGTLNQVVEKTAIIQASVSAEFRVLEENSSIFCFEDRTVLGALFETFGRVQAPCYTVKFKTEEEFERIKSRKGEKVYYVVSASKFVFTDQIKAIKGSDASNLHDEEIPIEEQEFSDDEKELQAKQAKKKQKKNKGNNNQTNRREKKPQQNNQQRFNRASNPPRHDWDNPNPYGSTSRPQNQSMGQQNWPQPFNTMPPNMPQWPIPPPPPGFQFAPAQYGGYGSAQIQPHQPHRGFQPQPYYQIPPPRTDDNKGPNYQDDLQYDDDKDSYRP